nr:MucR family transcriptional regulator [Brevundimonas naejangsanensis]
MADIDTNLIDQTKEIAVAYFSNNKVEPEQVGMVLSAIHASLTESLNGPEEVEIEPVQDNRKSPAEVRRSITDAAIISFLDGKGYKTLKRHLSLRGYTPESYKEEFGLPHDYPMVAPAYSRARSQLAQDLGLGRKPAAPAPKAAPKKPAAKKAAEPAAPARQQPDFE